MHAVINVSPFATNVLDLVGRDDLQIPSGHVVSISRHGTHFVVSIGGTRLLESDDNIAVSNFLNRHEVGVNR